MADNIETNLDLFATINATRDFEQFQDWQSTKAYADWISSDPKIIARLLKNDLNLTNAIRIKRLILAGDL